MELRRDPNGLAPERLLVFDLTGDVQKFAQAARRISGLEFIGADDQEDEIEKDAVLYLMIPDAKALRQLHSLWKRWQANERLGSGFGPWEDLFAQLRDLRPWGPEDRVSAEDLSVLAQERADSDGFVKLELELVYRHKGDQVEAEALDALQAVNGLLVSRVRIDGAGYHALLVKIPQAELLRVVERGEAGLAGAEPIMHIRPQSVFHLTPFEPQETLLPPPITQPVIDEPIAAIFDAVPLAGHPRLSGHLSVDDPFNLEPLAVGPRSHGTAMASAVLHGDLNSSVGPLSRTVYFINVMYAPSDGGPERFPNRLPADIFEEAVLRMKAGSEPTAPAVIIINASLGDKNKPFSGRMSGWARVVDYLSYRYGLLFVISAGNHLDDLECEDVNTTGFEALNADERARLALRLSASAMATRRVLAPAEAMNALTVGALHHDEVPASASPSMTFDVWLNTGMCTISSGLGPGYGGSTKPDVLANGGRHYVRLMPAGTGHRLRPLRENAGKFGGILVAAPPSPTDVNLDRTSRTVGTSVAAALMTGVAARAHEALETVYDDFLTIPDRQRALLLKAMLVHCARWTKGHGLIREVVGPSDGKKHVQQRDNIRRYIGFGAVDPTIVLDCATDRATLWAVGQLNSEEAQTFAVPIPATMSGKPKLHEITATVSWFAPPRIGAGSYRSVRLKLIEPDDSKTAFAVGADKSQPDSNQVHRGTVIHRRWLGDKAPALSPNSTFDLQIQRQPDDLDEPVPYAIVVTISMAGEQDVYTQVRSQVAIKPPVRIPV